MKKRLTSLLLFISIFLGGCGYATEIDDTEYLIALGVDKGKTYHVRTTFVFANLRSDSEAEESSDKNKTDIVVIEAPTVYSALRQINNIKSKRIDLSHTKMITLSEEIAREGIGDYICGFVNSREFRPNTFFCVSECAAENYLSSVKPASEITIEKYFDLLVEKLIARKVNETYLYQLYFDLMNSDAGSIVSIVNVNHNSLPEEENKESVNRDDFSVNPTAGDFVRKADNETEIVGAAVIKEDKMVGKLGSFESVVTKLICDEFPTNYYSFLYPDSDDYVTLKLLQKNPPKINTKLQGGNAKIHINIPIKAVYVDIGHNMQSARDFKAFEKYLNSVFEAKADELIKKTQIEYQCDIFGFGSSMRYKFYDIPSWKSFNWTDKFQSADIKITFDIKITDSEELSHIPVLKEDY